MVWCSGSNLHIFMPNLKGHLLSTETRLLVNESLGVLGFRDNGEIPLSLHMITDTRQIELLFQEIESYSTPNSLPTKLDTFEHMLKKLLTTLVYQYLNLIHKFQIS